MNRYLRRLIGSRRVLTRFESRNNNTPVLVPRNVNVGLKCFGSGSLSQANQTCSQHGKTILQSLSEETQNKMMDDANLSDYPFSGDENLDFPEQPSLKTLLVSPERDYVISNKGEKVDIESLEDKVVALYFYEDFENVSQPLSLKELTGLRFSSPTLWGRE
ncbi:hypothetical protein POM88_048681 [Heracleum sosnowskyi]|uniref:Uncharacterized protein n=1 Tax=Heracleum sosnowskyi TaxID=360622 RepID=A0AAD8LYQ0_9APIA|nr:hypothetical protein POM88_048681 [Heracleum sosnowskyi]